MLLLKDQVIKDMMPALHRIFDEQYSKTARKILFGGNEFLHGVGDVRPNIEALYRESLEELDADQRESL